MNSLKKILLISLSAAAIAAMLFLVIGVAAPAFTKSSLLSIAASTTTPTPLPGEAIPLKSIAGLSSLTAQVTIDVNGLINGERAKGDLNAVVATNDQDESRISVTGSLLGDIAAQVGGSLVGLFTPSSVDIYKVPEGTYIVVNSLFPVCVKPADTAATGVLEDMSPQSLLSMLTSSEVARGKFVGQETINGVVYKHYLLNGNAFLAAAQKSSNPKLKAFGKGLWKAEDADLYVDARTGYPVAFLGSFSGAYEPLQFEGDFDVQVELTDINNDPEITLPASCKKPISP
jgi:hypothetical protein